ncbi:DNA-binding protein [Limnofasciculus baicalensis]|uniref:DNA-binding protein n=1 Tax=Limnofasciculus baicalensis BBK-W-15 TaxID=2699891 RepID=A0AAE3GXP4_9CYAN|nr:DNA-binding protein [Limnofasciculus baicalensis]MCP2732459.1 DNA-binding protein [Limnofasciculus baicalensis BBK-W-15]
MIKNQIQYEFSQEQAAKFRWAIAGLQTDEAKRKRHPLDWQSLIDSHYSQLESLQNEITEYETLIAHNPNQAILLNIDEINQLSDLLIKARIALKITEKELAYLCNITEEQIKAYEDKNYNNASFIDFISVIDALGIQIQEGQFFAKLDEFSQEHLTAMRESENLNVPIPASP